VAASKQRVRVSGVKEVQAALKKLEASSEDLKGVHTVVARGLLPGVVQRTPFVTGRLASSWAAGATKTRARITSKQPYAGPIEYGWARRNIEPARMVRDTVEAERGEILERYEDELAKLGARAGFEVRS
jgi:hypothetical protein